MSVSEYNKIIRDFAQTIKDAPNSKTSPYDTQAEVKRIDGDTAWVHIPGGVDETPVQLTTNAKKGDIVQVRVSGGRAWLYGNATAPPTDDTRANEANKVAVSANEHAINAVTEAGIAKEAADSAQASAATAKAVTDEIEGYAQTVSKTVTQVLEDGETAGIAAQQASEAATSALTRLSVVEDVADVLTWISEHGTYKLTADTSVIPGKMYFIKVGDDYNLVINPTGNPSQSGYYELDSINETVSNYVSSHLSLTNQGLWVINDSNSYKILLSSDGMKVYDKNWNLISTFGESISFSSNRPQYIGGEDAYIVFNSTDGTLIIGGSKVNISGNITLGGRTVPLSQLLTDMQSEIDESTATADSAYGEAIISTKTYYAYAEDISGNNFSVSDDSLPYRGIYVGKEDTIPEDSTVYKWEINPLWASKFADNYVHKMNDAIAIFDGDLGSNAYAGISALALTFFLNDVQQMKVGYDSSLEEYGVIAESLLAAGNGAGVKFDNTSEADSRGRFVWEIRNNGHLSLKRY